MTKSELEDGLHESVKNVIEFIEPQDRAAFEKRLDGKWSSGQQLHHLILAVKPLTTVCRFPKFLIRMLFGKAKGPSRTYDALRLRYLEKLEAGAVTTPNFYPKVVGIHEKDELLKSFLQKKDLLVKGLSKFNEEEMDLFALPHPLLGKLTLREMICFTIYHNEHHLSQMRTRQNITG